jgi:hypothetical protein
MNILGRRPGRRTFATNPFKDGRSLIEFANSLFVLVIFFMAIKTLEPVSVKSYCACARLFPAPFGRGQDCTNGATNASPMKRPIDWAMPDDREHHAARVCDDLLSSTYFMPISSQRPTAGEI